MPEVPHDFFLSDLLHSQKVPSRLFGNLLRQIFLKISLSQEGLERLARIEYGELIKKGHIKPNENLGSMRQAVISLVSRDEQDPTYAQVYCWIEAVKNSDELTAYCKKYYQDDPHFIEDLETSLWNSTEYKSPKAVADAFNFAQKFAQAPRMKRQRAERNIDDIHTDCEIDSIRSRPNIELQKLLEEH